MLPLKHGPVARLDAARWLNKRLGKPTIDHDNPLSTPSSHSEKPEGMASIR
jgi:hypothetical protein